MTIIDLLVKVVYNMLDSCSACDQESPTLVGDRGWPVALKVVTVNVDGC